MKITITTLIIVNDNEVLDVYHSLEDNQDKAYQELIDMVEGEYGDEETNTHFKSIKDIIYIPGQDTWSEHFPTPGKLRPSNFGHMFCEPNSQFNKLLRTQNKLKQKRK